MISHDFTVEADRTAVQQSLPRVIRWGTMDTSKARRQKALSTSLPGASREVNKDSVLSFDICNISKINHDKPRKAVLVAFQNLPSKRIWNVSLTYFLYFSALQCCCFHLQISSSAQSQHRPKVPEKQCCPQFAGTSKDALSGTVGMFALQTNLWNSTSNQMQQGLADIQRYFVTA